ncbi:MAG TPA: type II toxin-antitoxin system RelE/ParE family toxin [Candidatus Ornithospirochaeta avicola]|uniref:Type II toxin-antitoxin system RelE/ParE family toxin n=1 Tax=Candidatus Ornithospirochaeta avicola TaxID=2840896 RepID=A0A9D1PTK8_9SPIO|nr:type II toxin-antitoxin system RelE/ParE family toxin [Candidatus Ornithospirochaeta avicola]
MRIQYTETARKQLKKLDKTIQKRILDYMDEVGRLENPRSRGKALFENMRGLWRYRVGDYRVICEIQESRIIISVLKIGHYKNIY